MISTLAMHKLQTFVNHYRSTKSLALKFLCDGINPSRARFLGFDNLVKALAGKLLIGLTRDFLCRMCSSINTVTGPNGETVKVNVRVILAAYMIALYPKKVFETMGAVERELCDMATSLIARIQEVAFAAAFDGEPNVVALNTEILAYQAKFIQWKVPDESKLAGRINMALIGLYGVLKYCKVEDKVNKEAHKQIIRLRTKLEQISGPEELANFDSIRAQQERFLNANEHVPNEQLAHELIVNPAFRLTGPFLDSPKSAAMRSMFEKPFWQQVVEDLKENKFARPIRVLKQAVCTPTFNLADIESRFDFNTLTIDHFNEFVAATVEAIGRQTNVTATVEAQANIATVGPVNEAFVVHPDDTPVDFGETAVGRLVENGRITIRNANDTVVCLKFLVMHYEQINIRNANSRLAQIAPVVAEKGVEYEMVKFQTSLDLGTVSLYITRNWLHEFGVRCRESHTKAMLALVTGNKRIPETVRFDRHRIESLHYQLDSIALSASILSHIQPHLDEESFQLISHTYVLESDRYLSVDDGYKKIDAVLDATNLSLERRTALMYSIRTNCAIALKSQAVARLFNQSVQSEIALQTNAFTPPPTEIESDLAIFHDRISEMASEYAKAINLNWKVHCGRYKALNTRLARFVFFLRDLIPNCVVRLVPTILSYPIRNTTRRLIGL